MSSSNLHFFSLSIAITMLLMLLLEWIFLGKIQVQFRVPRCHCRTKAGRGIYLLGRYPLVANGKTVKSLSCKRKRTTVMEKAKKETDVNQGKTEQMDGHSLNGKCSGVLVSICVSPQLKTEILSATSASNKTCLPINTRGCLLIIIALRP